MLERSSIIAYMNKLDVSEQATVISALVEGNSIRSVERMTGVIANDLAPDGSRC